MSDTAQPRSQLLSKMRATFKQSSPSTQLPAQPQVNQSQQPASPPVVLNTAQQLEVLDTVLSDIEQSQPVEEAQPQPLQSEQPPQPQQPPQEEVQPPVVVSPGVSSPVAPQVSPQQPIQSRQQNIGMVAQATQTAVDQAVHYQQELQAAQSGSTTTKETIAGGGVDTGAAETGGSVQYVEQEPNPEISPEVAEYLQHVEDHANQEPQEVVVGEQQQQTPLPTNYQKQAVIVLPITPEIEKNSAKKSPLESIKWLVELSRKLMKMFSGKIIYREVENN